MTALTLAQADRLIDAILARGAELDCRPLSPWGAPPSS